MLLNQDEANLPVLAGIYYVLNRYKCEIIYIGCSKNLQKGWRIHHQSWDIEILETIYDDGRIICMGDLSCEPSKKLGKVKNSVL